MHMWLEMREATATFSKPLTYRKRRDARYCKAELHSVVHAKYTILAEKAEYFSAYNVTLKCMRLISMY